jgi:preprotein translocase subunit SecY
VDYSSLVIALIILAYGWMEYRKREKNHQVVMAHLARGEKPPEPKLAGTVERWKLFTTGGMVVLLLVVSAVFFMMGFRGHAKYVTPIFFMGGLGVLMAVAIGMMFVRDLRIYKKDEQNRKEK